MSIALSVIAICGTLTAVWVGSYLTRRNIEIQWRRDQKVKFYLHVLEEMTEFYAEAETAWKVRDDKDVSSDTKNEYVRIAKKLAATVSGAGLLSPQEVQNAFFEVLYTVNEIRFSLPRGMRDLDWIDLYVKLDGKIDRAIEVMKTDARL